MLLNQKIFDIVKSLIEKGVNAHHKNKKGENLMKLIQNTILIIIKFINIIPMWDWQLKN